jgi:hypothetical protein
MIWNLTASEQNSMELLMLHQVRVAATLLMGLLAAIFTADLGGGRVSTAAAEVPICSDQLRYLGKGPEGDGYWTPFPAVRECDSVTRLRKATPGCVRARCMSRGQCTKCRHIVIDPAWINYFPIYYADDSGCLKYVCTGVSRHR